ncbi:MAG: N-6 DNA methylase, partial [Oscillospiraceae bacterium]
GNSFTEDGTEGKTFSYMLCNPPFGVEWKKYEKAIKTENEKQGYAGRFGAGLPRISDGSFLFLQHMISKMKPVEEGGSRIAIVFNGSPLFTGDAGSGESEIRRWIIENDWLEAVVALPDQMFYNTGISTYIWIVTNRKSKLRRGKIQLINAVSYFEKMRKSLGSKRNQMIDTQIDEIAGLHKAFLQGENCKIFDNEDFGYWKITVERPVKYNFSCDEDRLYCLPIVFSKKKNCTWSWSSNDLDGQPMPQEIINLKNDLVALGSDIYTSEKQFKALIAPIIKKYKLTAMEQRVLLYNVLSNEDENGTIYLDAKGKQVANTSLRDFESIPLKEGIAEYFKREVLPHVPDAWIDESKTKKGYEIPFTRHFYKYVPLRESSVILSEIKSLEEKIQAGIAELFE